MGIWVDAAILLIILAGVIIGGIRGFFRSISKPVRVIASLIIAFFLAAPLATTYVEPVLAAPIEDSVATYLSDKCDRMTPDEVPTLVKIAATIGKVDLNAYMGETGEETAEKIAGAVSGAVAHLIATAVAFLALFFVTSLVLSLTIFLLDKSCSRGFLGALNRLCGMAISGVFAFLITWVACLIFAWVITLPALQSTPAVQEFAAGPIYTYFHELDPIGILLSF